MVTAAASVSFFRPEFDDFLYAPIGADRGEMPLSVLSALSRLDVDPWREAAELSELPKSVATQRAVACRGRAGSDCVCAVRHELKGDIAGVQTQVNSIEHQLRETKTDMRLSNLEEKVFGATRTRG